MLLSSASALVVAQTTVRVEASFNGFHCDGKPGLCAMEKAIGGGNAVLYTAGSDLLIFEISRSQLTERDHHGLFGFRKVSSHREASFFLSFPSEYIFSSEISEALGLSKNISIEEGRYRILIKEETYQLQLKIK